MTYMNAPCFADAPLQLSAVVLIDTPYVKVRDVEAMFSPGHAPGTVEIIDTDAAPKVSRTFDEAARHTQEMIDDLHTQWPGARVCFAITSGVVPTPQTPTLPVANVVRGAQQDLMNFRTLNPRAIQMVIQGHVAPSYPLSARETKHNLAEFLQFMIKPARAITPYMQQVTPLLK